VTLWRTRLRRGLSVGVGLLLAGTVAANSVPEHELKAALTYKLAKFVTWPAERELAATFELCVLGEHPFESALDGIDELTIKERPIAVRSVASVVEPAACDLLFIAASESERLAELLAELADMPVLTVSDMPRFAKRGGIVELQSRDNRVGFEINVPAYRRAGLVVSSQLLQLATLVDAPIDGAP
jgi:YfiR/HmsC-like